MRYFHILPLLLLTGLSGCISYERITDLSMGELKQFNEIKLIENPAGLDYESMGEVKGLSCRRQWWDKAPTEEEATIQFKIKAIKLNANAILSPKCLKNPTLWESNCWESWVCTGEAVLIK